MLLKLKITNKANKLIIDKGMKINNKGINALDRFNTKE